MLPPSSAFFQNATLYHEDCAIINKLSATILYNFKSEGFGTVKLYDGTIIDDTRPHEHLEYTILNKTKLTKNQYNFYEQEIDLNVLKMQGSS